MNSKWIKDLNVRSETVTLIQEKIGNTLDCVGNNFMNVIPIAQKLRERIDKWDCIKQRSFCIAKETVTRLKNSLQNGRKSLPVT
jgi:hypothetical protein